MNSSRSPFLAASFKKLASAEAQHWWFCARNRVVLWILASKISSFNSFLEIGCGTGFVLEAIWKAYPKAELFGAEFFDEGLVFARERIPSANFTQVDVVTMDEFERYDVIGAFDVIEHIEEDQKVLHNVARALKPSGEVVITVPQHRWLWSLVDQHACHVRRYSRAELIEKVQRAGLKVEYVSSFVSLLLPLMWLARLRADKGDYDPMREFRIPGWLNWTLAVVMSVEFFMLKLGVRFPVGGSLLLVAKKPSGGVN